MFSTRRIVLALVLCAVCATPSFATWSILAVDRETGQVGAAGASCTWCVYGIATIRPGLGGVVVQAMSNGDAREKGIQMLREGAGAKEALAAMRAPEFDPENQQYAVVALKSGPVAVYTGKENSGFAGQIVRDGVSVQGNILVSEKVLTAAMDAFQAAADKPLPDRLMAALEAGAAAGGDSRCGEQVARSAFVTVFDKDNARAEPYVDIVYYGIPEGGDPAVEKLAAEFAKWKKDGAELRSTRRYIVQE